MDPGLGLFAFARMLRKPDARARAARRARWACCRCWLRSSRKIMGWPCISMLLMLATVVTFSGILGGIIPSKLGCWPCSGSDPDSVCLCLGLIPARFAPAIIVRFIAGFSGCLLSMPLPWVSEANLPKAFYTVLSLICTGYYFAHFLLVLPVLGKIEKTKPLPASIAASVTQAH